MRIQLENVGYRYRASEDKSVPVLKDINLDIQGGAFTGLIGPTGSGKSTLLRLLNGLYRPTEGRVIVDGKDIHEKGFDLRRHRTEAGLVFQYPEHQLFGEDVLGDVCFGPMNMGLDRGEAELRAYEALKLTGIDEECYGLSPFELSGGQRRRVAIAGVIAMRPSLLIMDEPTAGLDPQGAKDILDMTERIRRERGMGVIIVTHNMEEIAGRAGRIIAVNGGRIALDGTPEQVFSRVGELEAMGLKPPEATQVLFMLKAKGLKINTDAVSVKHAVEAIINATPAE